MAQQDWDELVDEKPWLLSGVTSVVVGESSPAGARRGIRSLSELIERASATPVHMDGQDFELLTWSRPDKRRLSWLCLPPSAAAPTGVFTDHERLLAQFGGVVEMGPDEPPTWLLNCNSALTERGSLRDASFIDHYLWIMKDHGGTWPIDPARYYPICEEANGNTTLCDRHDGSIVLFAPDHSFDLIVPLPGCPPYSLYRIPSAPNFASWVDAVATQWLGVIA